MSNFEPPTYNQGAPSLNLLMRFEATVSEELVICREPRGAKLSVCYFRGGSFEGQRLRGTLLSGGGDWATYKSPDHLDIDVRGMLRTSDGALVYMVYRGIWRALTGNLDRVLAPEGERFFRPADHYFRVSARFETADQRYAWLNHLIAIGIGHRSAVGVGYDFYELL